MAFEGNLRELEFGDVVQTLSMTRQHGTLVITGSEERRVAFTDRGMALLSARRSHGERVGAYLAGTGRTTHDALEAARRATRRDGGAAIGDALLAAGVVEEAAVAEARRYVAQDELFELFRLREGSFKFLNDELDLSGPFAALWFDVGGVAMEAARRIDESPRLDAVVPRHEVLTRADPECAPAADTGSDDQRKLYDRADGTCTVGDLLDSHHLGAFDTRKVLASLVESGALRAASAEEILTTVDGVSRPGCAAKLLRRAVELDARNAEAWQKLAKALAASGDKPAAAVALCELASLQYTVGHGESALATLRTALKLRRQSPEAHAMLTRILLALELVDDAVDAAHDAVTECLAADAPQTALEIALAAKEHAPDDRRLQRGAAAAYAALGRNEEAVAILDGLAHALSQERGSEKSLAEVYRSILSIAPDRADARENLEEVLQREALRKRRRRQLMAGAAALLLILSIALPSVLGSNVQERLDRMNALLAEERLDEVQLLLNELRDEGIDDPLLDKAAEALQRRVDDARRPTLDNAVPAALKARIEAIYERSRAQFADGRLVHGLASLLEAVPILESDDHAKIAEARPGIAKSIRDDYESEVRTALLETESACLEKGTWAVRALDELQGSRALERAEYTTEPDDLAELEMLATLAREVETLYDSNDWSLLRPTVTKLVESTRAKSREFVEKIGTAAGNTLATLEQARSRGERAIAHVDRARLLGSFRDAKTHGSDLVSEGKLEEAAEEFAQFLEFCKNVRDAEHGTVHEQIIGSYLATFQLEQLIRERAEQIDDILARERTAADALLRGDVGTAFEMRVGLVREFGQVGFSARFSLPLRIESRPPGAEIVLRTEEGDQTLGRTTSIVEYPAIGDSTIVVRLDGFEDVVLERRGAFDDNVGEEVLELMKRPLWRSEPGAATEAAPVVWKDRVLVADRDGVIRALSLDDGTEIGRLETGLLGGFSGTPALRDDRVYLAGVDGVGFVLDPASLEILHRFDLPGAVRTTLTATALGVLIVDERGSVHLVDDEGDDLWTRAVGSVVVDAAATEDRVVLVTLDGQMVVLRLSDGEERRRRRLPGRNRWFTAAISGGHAVFAAENGTLSSVDLASGSTDWEVDMEARLTGRAAVAHDLVAVPTSSVRVAEPAPGEQPIRPESSGNVALYRPGAAGDRVELAPVGPVGDGLCSTGDGFVLAGRTGIVRRLNGRGLLAWRFDAGDAIGARPVHDGARVVIVTRGGQVVVLED